jgi:hypothetical protein
MDGAVVLRQVHRLHGRQPGCMVLAVVGDAIHLTIQSHLCSAHHRYYRWSTVNFLTQDVGGFRERERARARLSLTLLQVVLAILIVDSDITCQVHACRMQLAYRWIARVRVVLDDAIHKARARL